MPIARDAETGNPQGTPTTSEQITRAAQDPYVGEVRQWQRGPSLIRRQDNVMQEILRTLKTPAPTDEPMFNPTALIDAGRVNDIPKSLYPRSQYRWGMEEEQFPSGSLRPSGSSGLTSSIFTMAGDGGAGRETVRQAETAKDEDSRKTSGHYNPPMRNPRRPGTASALDKRLLEMAAAKPAEPPDFAFSLLHPQMPQLADELGMKTGALTTVPEVADYEPSDEAKAGRITGSSDIRSQILSDVAAEAREKGIKGRGMQAYMQEQLGHPGTEEYMQARLKPEESVEDQQERRDRTTRNALNAGGSRTKTDELTAEEYAKLNPRGKAAVDLNTLLVSAIREDMKGKKRNDSDAGGKEYDAAVADIFGEEGAADAAFVPQTMRVLHDIGFKADGTNLDDVLKLKVGLTAEDIADISTKNRGSKDASLLTPEKVRDDLTESLVKAFRKQRLDPQRGSALLETQRDVLNTREALDFGGDANNQFIEQVYEFLANPANKDKVDKTMAMAKNTLSEEDWPKFLAFLDVRSREAQQYDRPLGLNGEVEYMKPRAFRHRLGL